MLTLAEMTDHNAYLFKRLAYQRLSRATAAIANSLHDWDRTLARILRWNTARGDRQRGLDIDEMLQRYDIPIPPRGS